MKLHANSILGLALLASSCANSGGSDSQGPPATPKAPPQLLGVAWISDTAGGTGVTLAIDGGTAEASAISNLGLAGLSDVRAMASDLAAGTHYAISFDSGLLVRVNASDGVLDLVGPALRSVTGMTFDDTGRLLACRSNGELFALNPETGEPTLLGQASIPALGGTLDLQGLAFDQDGQALFAVANDSPFLLQIDLTTLDGSPVGATGHSYLDLHSLEYEPSTMTLYAIDRDGRQLVGISPGDGTGVPIGNAGLLYSSWESLCASPSGGLLASESSDNILGEVDAQFGTASSLLPLATQPLDLAFDPISKQLLMTTMSHGIATVDPLSGIATSITEPLPAQAKGLAYDPFLMTTYCVVEGSWLATIDGESGAVTLLSENAEPYTVGDLAFDQFTGTLFGIDEITQQIVRIMTHYPYSFELLPQPTGFGDLRGLAFGPNGFDLLYSYDSSTDQLITIDTGTGLGTAVGPVESEVSPSSLAFDADTLRLFATASGFEGSGVAGEQLVGGPPSPPPALLLDIDTESGLGTSVGMLGRAQLASLTYDSLNDVFYGVDNASNALVRVDPLTGESTFVARLADINGNLQELPSITYVEHLDLLLAEKQSTSLLYYTVDRVTGVLENYTMGGSTIAGDPSFGSALGSVEHHFTYDATTEAFFIIQYDSGTEMTRYFVMDMDAATQGPPLSIPGQFTPLDATFDTDSGRLILSGSRPLPEGHHDEFAAFKILSVNPADPTDTIELGSSRWPISAIAFRPE